MREEVSTPVVQPQLRLPLALPALYGGHVATCHALLVPYRARLFV